MAFVPAGVMDTFGRVNSMTDPDKARENIKQEKLRKMSMDIAKRSLNVQNIFNSKLEDILAKQDKESLRLIKSFEDVTTKEMQEITKAIISGDAVTNKQMASYIENQHKFLKATEASGQVFEMSLNDIIAAYQSQMESSHLSDEERKGVFDELLRVMGGIHKSSKLAPDQVNALKELVSISGRGNSMTQDQARSLATIANELKDDDITTFKMKGTIEELNRNVESIMISDKKLQELLNKKIGEFSFEELATSLGLKEAGGILKGGIIDMILATLGLGGLGVGTGFSFKKIKDSFVKTFDSIKDFRTKIKDKFVSISNFFKDLSKKIRNVFTSGFNFLKSIPSKLKVAFSYLEPVFDFFKKIFTSVRTFFKGGLVTTITSLFTKLTSFGAGASKILPFVKKAVKFLGPLAAIFTALEGVYNFLNAGDMAGKSEEAVTFFDRINAVISGFISSFSFGLLDPKEVFKKIDEAANYMINFGVKVIDFAKSIGTALENVWDDVVTGVSDFVMTLWDEIKAFFINAVDASLSGLGLAEFFNGPAPKSETKEEKGIFSSAADFLGFGSDTKKSLVPALAGKNTGSTSKLVDSLVESEKRRNASFLRLERAMKTSKRNIILPSPSRKSNYVEKSTTIDDFGIALTNSFIFGS